MAITIAPSAGWAAEDGSEPDPSAEKPEIAEPADATRDSGRLDGYHIFPRRELFAPLQADLRWPRFSAEHQWRLGTDEFDRVGAVSFGETFAFVQSPQRDWGQWELGFQAMVDAIFDMTNNSFDLANEDYFVGLTGSFRKRGVTALLRVYHISAHIGDEYLIENGGGRKSVSYEVIDLLVSHEPFDWLRVYGGGGVLVNPSPSYDPIVTQFGFELTSPLRFASGWLTPIFGTDLQLRQENDWTPEVAVLTGLRLADPADDVRRIELFARFYHGRSPDGQFFEQTIDLVGLGLRLGF